MNLKSISLLHEFKEFYVACIRMTGIIYGILHNTYNMERGTLF